MIKMMSLRPSRRGQLLSVVRGGHYGTFPGSRVFPVSVVPHGLRLWMDDPPKCAMKNLPPPCTRCVGIATTLWNTATQTEDSGLTDEISTFDLLRQLQFVVGETSA